jgi:two-component system, OmpR family, KDP operon response regulator KdpE
MDALVLAILGAASLRDAVVRQLTQNGLETIAAPSWREALALASRSRPALVILDRLWGENGVSLTQELRRSHPSLILYLGPQGDEAEVVAALDAGVDSYVALPCSLAELTARVRALLRRRRANGHTPPSEIRVGDLTICLPFQRVTCAGQPISLAPKEYEILAVLAERLGRVVSRADLLRLV